MRNIKDKLYISSWRRINKSLFNAYVTCYNNLTIDKKLKAPKELKKSLTDNSILLKYTEDTYSKAYEPARELGIYYENEDKSIELGDYIYDFIQNKISYETYMKIYCLNYKALINDKVISPLEVIIAKSLTNINISKNCEEIFEDCKEIFNPLAYEKSAFDSLDRFLGRMVEAQFLELKNKKYHIINGKIYEYNFDENIENKSIFESKYMQGNKESQKNLSIQMINKHIPNEFLQSLINNVMKNDLSKNIILYGPPGTGKTDYSIELSLDILGLNQNDRIKNREVFKSVLHKRVFFVTMHPSFSYEDFIQGIKPITNSSNLNFNLKDGVFKKVSDFAKTLYENEGELNVTSVNNKDILYICFFLSKFNTKLKKDANLYFGFNSNSEVYNYIGLKYNLKTNTIKNLRDAFDFLVSDSRTGWKPKNGSIDKLDNSDLWPFQDVYLELKDKSFDELTILLNDIKEKSTKSQIIKEENINYVIILDEINRANISKVFGEIITLLEDDKRIDGNNELSVLLPSGETFSIPPNLYVIGTMNTADKSISLVDIALRRRFQFMPLYPNKSIIQLYGTIDKIEKVNFMELLNEKLIDNTSHFYKGVDFQIGHSYFLKNNTLKDVINENIIPLLSEYYRSDLVKVKDLMDEIGFNINSENFTKTGLLEYNGKSL